MQVNLAKTAGFCFGVDRAVNLVYDLLAKGKRFVHSARLFIISDLLMI